MTFVVPVHTFARVDSRPLPFLGGLLFGITLGVGLGLSQVQAAESQTVYKISDVVLPSSSSNAALHYQRALLFLAAVDRDQQQLLDKPIWEIVNAGTTKEEIAALNSLLIASRHAIRSALVGAAQLQADFGTDLQQYAATTLLPHVVPMSRLAKLVALHGMQRQAAGNWQEAAQIYLDVVRMGRHMSQQLTLAETIKGVRILETGYHTLANWAVECPDTALIKQVRSNLIAISPHSLSPVAAIKQEANLLQLSLANLQHAYPDGNWAEMILVAIDAKTPSQGPQEMRATAREMALQRGIPESVFNSKDSFDTHVGKLRATNQQYYDELLACVAMPASEAICEGERIHEKFAPRLKKLGDPDTLNPCQIAAFFAVHQAEHQLVNLVLALSAHKQNGRFPEKLTAVADDFGGSLPGSPYGSEPVTYTTTEDGNGMQISYPETKVGSIVIPKVAFEYAGPMHPPVEK